MVRRVEALVGGHDAVEEALGEVQDAQAGDEPLVAHFSRHNVKLSGAIVYENGRGRLWSSDFVRSLPLERERGRLVVEHRCLDGRKVGILPQLALFLALGFYALVTGCHVCLLPLGAV